MKHLPILEDPPWGTGDHPDAMKPLSAFRQITAICNDCGHAKTMDESALAALSAVPSLGVLAKHSFCSACRTAGAAGKANIEFRTEPIDVPKTRPVEWSMKPVFTEERSDPLSNLPRRSIFDRRIPKLERMR